MGETAKILNPENSNAYTDLECSPDLNCPATEFTPLVKIPDRLIVVYANISAEVKAMADWVVTLSIAVKLIEYLRDKNKIIWAPDKHLGMTKLQNKSRHEAVNACIVHKEFKAKAY